MTQPQYFSFLGQWELVPESCIYEQGEAPLSAAYTIEENDGALTFHMEWTDSSGESHKYSFSGRPDGEQKPFAGGDLADALSITAVSDTELNSAAFFKGRELMKATRTLENDGVYMDIRQSVVLPDLTEPTNYSRFKRVVS